MPQRNPVVVLAMAAVLAAAATQARAFDDTKYPDLKGVWLDTGSHKWGSKDEKPPLTPEYQAIFEANLADQAAGGPGDTPTLYCLPPGMPRQMNVYEPMQIVIEPDMVHLLIEHVHDSRRIYTDGRDWPKEMEPMFAGYSIGHWVDTDGGGRYDELDVETRGLKGPRTFDSTGIPLAKDNETVVKERIWVDKANPDLLRDEITTFDHALTHPWTITKTYRRSREKGPVWWRESICAEDNPHVRIGKDDYYVSSDGYLMPTRKGQAPPDLRYFKRTEDR
jgi:hypothetical protein